jgi:putative ABC transport system permease protein
MFSWMKSLASRIRTWLSPRDIEQDFDRELAAHLDLLTEENIRRGMSPDEAQRAARIRLGGLTQLKETNRELRGLPLLETFLQDTRYAFRMLRKNPGFTAIAVLTLALGIGANTAIFSVVDAVMLRPLPYPNPAQLVNLLEDRPQKGTPATGPSYPDLEDWHAQNHAFTQLAGLAFHKLTLIGRGEPTVVNTVVVTSDFFHLLDVKPLLGQTLLPDDFQRGAAAAVVLSENLWRSRFGGDPSIIGSPVSLDNRSFTVVGVMPAGFRSPFIDAHEVIWIPIAQDPVFSRFMSHRGVRGFPVLGRLKPGVSLEQASAEMNAVLANLAKAFPDTDAGFSIRIEPLQQAIVGNTKVALLVLLGAVGLVLLIACANIANLLLARATSRAREIAVRATLGAGRARLVRQLLSETAVLGLLGGTVGIALAYGGVHALRSLLPSSLPVMNPVRVDIWVLGFALLLSAIAGCIFGLAPALFAANANLQSNLREGGGRSGESAARRRARSSLAAGEIALAMVLLVVAGLLLRSFAKLTSVSPGFDARHIVQADISFPQFEYSTPQQWALVAGELLQRIQSEPGLQDSAIAVPRPIVDGSVTLPFAIEGIPSSPSSESQTANYASVSPNYFHVMGIPLLAGRLREIVGIVGDVRDISLGQHPGAMMYVPFAQAPLWGANLVVRSALSPASVAAAIRQDVHGINKDLPVTDVAKMPDLIDASVSQPRFRTFLLGLFAAMALALAATGIFGVISYSVSRRTNEIGIRVALGASRSAILRMVLRETLVLTFAGMAIGIPCALAGSHLVVHMLFGVTAYDPTTIGVVILALAAVAALAGYIPARRAMRVDPVVALRFE